MNTKLFFTMFLLALSSGTIVHSQVHKPVETKKHKALEQFSLYSTDFESLNVNSSYNELIKLIKTTSAITQTLQEQVNDSTKSTLELTYIAMTINEIIPYTELFFTCKKNSLSALLATTLIVINLITMLNQIKRNFSTADVSLEPANNVLAAITTMYNKIHALDYTRYVGTSVNLENNFKRIQVLLAV